MITVLGATGFIGASLVKKLKEAKADYYAPGRNEDIEKENLGDIIYCIGLTADFRTKPFETIEAHVCVLNKLLSKAEFNSLTYLSSTRVYINSKEQEVFENSPISIRIDDADDLYTLSKLTGERLCLSSGREARIARLSNVYGIDDASENFIKDINTKIKNDKFVKFFSTGGSSKDYIFIDKVCDLLIDIATRGTRSIYNVASGQNISNDEIIGIFKNHYDFRYEFDKNAKEIIFPRINIDKIKNEFNFSSTDSTLNLSELIKNYSNDQN